MERNFELLELQEHTMSRSLHAPSYQENAMMLTNHGQSPLPAFLRAAEKSRSHLLADAAARHTPALDGAVDALLDSGDLSTESTPRCGRCGESMPIAAYSHGGAMVCVTCYLSLSDDAGSAMEGDRWE